MTILCTEDTTDTGITYRKWLEQRMYAHLLAGHNVPAADEMQFRHLYGNYAFSTTHSRLAAEVASVLA